MKTLLKFILIAAVSLTVWSCKDSSSGSNSNLNEAPSEKQFIWDAMNYWYFWQEDISQLADNHNYFESEQAYHDYLIGFDSPRALFEDLIYEAEDDFSFFINDWEVFRQAQQGNTFSFGFEYGLVHPDTTKVEIFGYVQYVIPNTPADEAGLKRGDIFNAINGTRLTVNNYRNLLSNSTYELTMADFDDWNITENGEVILINSTTVQEDPIHISTVFEAGSSKVGYLLYNAFQINSHEGLNDVFGDFLSEGIDELVLDLRYNGGGRIRTSAVLASLISGLGESEEFAVLSFNSKRTTVYNTTEHFLDQVPIYDESGENVIAQTAMNSLSINRLFVLTGFGTASASEAVINGLEPFLDVILIGRQTVGKDDGSLTLYDAPADYTDRNQANPNHKYAIQPIILKVVNSVGESNGVGFPPDHPVNELAFLDDLPPLGDENDPLLARALELISGEPMAKSLTAQPAIRAQMFKDSRDLERFGKDMYVTPAEIKRGVE